MLRQDEFPAQRSGEQDEQNEHRNNNKGWMNEDFTSDEIIVDTESNLLITAN